MIDVKDINKYYMGKIMYVVVNAGGIFLELSEDIDTLLYKIDDDTYVDVNRKAIAQVLRRDTIVTSSIVVDEQSLIPATKVEDITNNAGLFARLSFKPNDFKKNK